MFAWHLTRFVQIECQCTVFPLITRKLHCPQLHFSNPTAYNDIYNNRNKWDKDHSLYRAFDLDTSTFGFIHYSDAKQRRDVLAPFFSRTSNWDATKVPDFQSDIVLASQAVLPILTMHKYSGPLLKMMRYIPMRFGKNFGTPVTKALFLLREVSIRPKARVAIETFPHRRYWTRLTKSYVTQAAWKMRPIKSFIIRCWVAMPKEDDRSPS